MSTVTRRWGFAFSICLVLASIFLAVSPSPAAESGKSGVLKLPEYTSVIRCMLSDSAGRLWIGSFGAGLWMVDRDRIVPATDPQGEFPSRRISRLLLEGHLLWAACAGEGLLCYDIGKRAWVPVSPDPGPEMRYLHGLARSADGSLQIGSVGSGAAFLANGSWSRLSPDEGLGDDWINDIVPDGKSVWYATSRGVFRLSSDRPPEWLYPQGAVVGPDTWENPEVNVVLPVAPYVFLGTMSDGAFRMDADGEETKLRGTAGNIQALLIWKNSLWAAGSHGVWRVDHHLGHPVASSRSGPWEPGCPFKSLAISPTGTLLAGTLDGRIFETADGKRFSLILRYAAGAFRRP